MTIEQPGLKRRMGKEARRISSQHRQLDILYEMVTRAADQGDAEAARTHFTRFADALDAHFSLEDGFYFPALHGMRPELTGELEELSREHVGFRSEVEALGALLEQGETAGFSQRLDALAVGLAHHEGAEERLLARLRPEGATGD
jgi:hypothetical protein